MAGLTGSCMDINKYSASFLHYYTLDIPALLEKYLKQVKWQTFAELGCGDGALLYALSKGGYFKDKQACAVDISSERVLAAQKIDRSVKCFQGDVCDIKDISNGSVDLLVSKQVIEHVENEERMVKEVSRVLNESGVAYFSTVFKKRYAWYFYRCKGKWALDPTHVREYMEESPLLELFAKHGLRVLESKKTLFWFPVTDFIFKRLKSGRNIYHSKFLNLLRKLKLPIPGYYEWEMVLKK